jgi:hypothetical protein
MQAESPLFAKLPRELRDMIWTHVISASVLTRPNSTLSLEYAFSSAIAEARITQGLPSLPLKVDGPQLGVIGLLTCCRRIHDETVHLLYEIPKFAFISVDTFYGFVACVGLEKIRAVRDLEIWLIKPELADTDNNGGSYGVGDLCWRLARIDMRDKSSDSKVYSRLVRRAGEKDWPRWSKDWVDESRDMGQVLGLMIGLKKVRILVDQGWGRGRQPERLKSILKAHGCRSEEVIFEEIM